MVSVLLVAHAAHAAALSMTQDEVDECQGWLSGVRDTYVDQGLMALGRRTKNHSISGGFTSQRRQDKQMWLALFKQQHEQQQLRRQRSHGAAHHERPFTYADVAANHFKRISNTYFYDRCLGWRGLCVEPNPRYHADLREKRSCELVPTRAVGAHTARA